MIAEINRYVKSEIENLTEGQYITLKALIHAGYRGEREKIVNELIRAYGGESIVASALVEDFTLEFKGKKVRYWRIIPEYYRAVRRVIYE